jgi:hypothetical protein
MAKGEASLEIRGFNVSSSISIDTITSGASRGKGVCCRGVGSL